jgi:hypothetical protein
VKQRQPTNLAASVHARLLNQARSSGRSFNDLVQLYAMERFLYRLSKSPHGERFILKGALLLRVWDPASYRTTRDIDLLGRISNEIDTVVSIVQGVCQQAVEPDGVTFDPASVIGETIVEGADYAGIRIAFRGALGNTRLLMRIDIGFGDTVTPAARQVEFPTFLGMPAPRLKVYPPETTVAEKLQVMFRLGEANSRMKDFHDIWWLARALAFEGRTLAQAIAATCERRGTPVPTEPTALTPQLGADPSKAAQWRAFHRRLNPTDCPEDFTAVVEDIARFLRPVVEAVSRGAVFEREWRPAGPWT